MRAVADTQKPRSCRLIDTQSRRQSEEKDVDAMAYSVCPSAPLNHPCFSLHPLLGIACCHLADASGVLSVQRH